MALGDVLLSTNQAAIVYGVPARTVRYRIAHAHLARYGLRGRPRYLWSDLDTLLGAAPQSPTV